MKERRQYKLCNLDCASCASKIEERLSAVDAFSEVSVSFPTAMLTLTADGEADQLIDRINREISRVEPECVAVELSQYSGTSHTDGHAHEQDHAHSHEHEGAEGKWQIGTVIASAVLFVVAYLCKEISWIPTIVSPIVFVLSILLSGWPVFLDAVKSLRHISLDEHLLVTIAVIAASFMGEFAEAAAVTLFFGVGELFEHYAVGRSRKSIAALSEIRPDTANLLLSDGTSRQVDAKEVEVGATLQILPFERVPLDGEVLSGESTMDASAITGESAPQNVGPQSELLSGMINGSGTLTMRVINPYAQSAASRIIDMVENAAQRKAPAERLVTKFAKIYTPVVVAMAALLAVVPPLLGGDWRVWAHNALVFLVASCPCALVLSVPLSFFAGVGAAAKRGILVKGGSYIETLEKPGAIVFDKTGTLTTDQFAVTHVAAVNGASEQEVLEAAALAEYRSSHPIARSIVEAFGTVDESRIEDFSETPGGGTRVTVDGTEILCGAKRLMQAHHIDLSALPDEMIYVARGGQLLGAISVSGKLREDSALAVKQLRALGVNRIVMLTGDHEEAAKAAAEACGITEYHAGLLPEEKVELLEQIKRESGVTAFVGDGINDAPVLAAADVGIAMGLGTDAAIEAGDVVLTNNQPSKLPQAITLFRRCMRITRFNIAFALIVKGIVLVLGAMSLAGMWAAVFADVGVTVLAVLNSARILRKKS